MRRFILSLTLLAGLATGQSTVLADTVNEERAAGLISDALSNICANKNNEAIAGLRKALALVPKSTKAHHTLGVALAKIGDSAGAIKEFITAIELDPRQDFSWLTLGGLYQSTGRLDEALATYDEFLTRFKNVPDLRESCNKVASLKAGLAAERDRLRLAREATAVLHSAYPLPKSSLLTAPAESATDDYVPEATRQGHIHLWAKMPIKVFVRSPLGVKGYKPAWGTILKQSFRDWETASNGLIRFEFVDKPLKEGIEVIFVAVGGAENGYQHDAEAGETLMYTISDDLHFGTIKIMTKSFSSVMPLTNNRMRFTCLHEIGHALGLSGHTDNPKDVMFFSTSFKDEWRDLTGRDARTIQRLYAGR